MMALTAIDGAEGAKSDRARQSDPGCYTGGVPGKWEYVDDEQSDASLVSEEAAVPVPSAASRGVAAVGIVGVALAAALLLVRAATAKRLPDVSPMH